MKEVWVITGEYGEYSDYSHWVEGVASSLEESRNMMERIAEIYINNDHRTMFGDLEGYSYQSLEGQDKEGASPDVKVLGKIFDMDYPQSSYSTRMYYAERHIVNKV